MLYNGRFIADAGPGELQSAIKTWKTDGVKVKVDLW